MRNIRLFSCTLVMITSGVLCVSAQTPFYITALDSAAKQLARLTTNVSVANHFPRTINTDGTVKTVLYSDWTSGFFSGCLWRMYEYTQDTVWKSRAVKWTTSLDSAKYKTNSHDVGFILYCSYGNGLQFLSQTDKAKYEAVLLKGSQSLSTRYRATVKAIRSWDFMAGFPVIIDNMMNLEMLCHVSKQNTDSSFIKIAIAHATTTKKNHFRPNYSSFHVVNYDSVTGAVVTRQTYQGFADSSSWARGQAWGVYGYTFMYRETGDTAYLSQARHIADYILNHPRLPSDLIPYWDYDAPASSNPPRDASAAAITASALIELSGILNNATGAGYLQKARAILTSLSSSNYFAAANTNANFILKHSTGNLPANTEIDVPLIYADYYYLEGLLRLRAVDASSRAAGNTKQRFGGAPVLAVLPTSRQGVYRVESLAGGGAACAVQISDLFGRIVNESNVSSKNPVLDMRNLPAGCYTARVSNGSSSCCVRFLHRW
jgi:unsaturated chondroitin disaccharide hydrolase